MNYKIEIEQEEDGRYIAEIVELPGVLVVRIQVKNGSRWRNMVMWGDGPRKRVRST